MSTLIAEPGSRLVERCCRDRDPAARDALIRHYTPLAHRLAARYRATKESQEDLEQVACLGLIKAIDRYDPDRGAGSLPRYAIPTILGELKRHFRNATWAVHTPRILQEHLLKVSNATDTLSIRSGRSPTTAELAAETGLSPEEVLEAQEVGGAYNVARLDAPLGGDPGERRSLGDSLGSIDDGFERTVRRESVLPALRELPERDRLILHLRFFEDLTQSEIAAEVGISQMHVSRLLSRALGRLNAHVVADHRFEAA